MTGTRWHVPVLGALALLLFSINIGGYDLWPPDEPRFGEVAREMFNSGDYLVPTVNGKPYLEKPPLLFWMICAASVPFGEVNEISTRIPSVLAGVITVLLTYLLARRMFNAHTALWAALVLMTCQRFWWQARTGQIDMLLTCCMTCAMYVLWRWDDERRMCWLVALYAAMAAGLMAKGPPALIFPLAFIFSFYWNNKAGRRGTHWIIGTLAALAITAAWFIPARMAAAHASDVALQAGIGGNLFRNTIGRAVLGVSKFQWPWFYLISLPVDLVPWTLFLPWLLPWFWRNRRENKMMFFLWCWIVPAFVVFSIILGKRAIYILPLFPAIGIAVGAGISVIEAVIAPKWKRRIAGFLSLVMLLLFLISYSLVAVVTVIPNGIPGSIVGFSLVSLILSLWLLVNVIAPKSLLARRLFIKQELSPNLVLAMFVLLLAVSLFVFPAINESKGARKFCGDIRSRADNGMQFNLYSVGFGREEYLFYSHHFYTPVFTELLGADDMSGAEMKEAAASQRKGKKIITAAATSVPIYDIVHVLPNERVQLRAAIDAAVANAGKDADDIRAFEALLKNELAGFGGQFNAAVPSYAYVQAEDWRWMVALQESPIDARVIGMDSVGSREVLLLANTAGMASYL